MRLFIEGYNYQPEDINGLGLEVLRQRTTEGVNFKYVGYYYDTKLEDCVFFLPKVIIDETGKAFGSIDPNKLINLFAPKNKEEEKRIAANKSLFEKKDFLCNLSIWIYRAVKKYVVSHNSRINSENIYSNLAINSNTQNYTLLDIILSLIKFNNENRDYFMFVVKNQHSGLNKINWNKTISRTTAYIEDDVPLYLSPINKTKQINFDEELLVIFYSILNYIGRTFGFKSSINLNYKLIQHNQFKHYLRSFGKIRLRQIKYKYFSDKALTLWKLCYSFFDKIGQAYSAKDRDDYLLVSDFNPIFEDMVDDLLSDKSKYIQDLKQQEDGKKVDHIFKYYDLVQNDQIYYIGDSKYYKIDAKPQNTAHYKQYTYAKNIIQTMIDLFVTKQTDKDKTSNNYRDDITEGYNITPNFFIRGTMDKKLSFSEKGFKALDFDIIKDRSVHFGNRLFDRDTLLLGHFDINFLYVLSMYTSNNKIEKRMFKAEAHKKFRDLTIKILNDNYAFYRHDFDTKQDLEFFAKEMFQKLLGKMFATSDKKLIVAFENDKCELNNGRPLHLFNNKIKLYDIVFTKFELE